MDAIAKKVAHLRLKVRGFSFPFHATSAEVPGRDSTRPRVAVPTPKAADLRSRSRYEAPLIYSQDISCLTDAWERRVLQLARTRIKPVPPVQVVFEEIRGMTRISGARGEAPLYMLDNLAYLRQGSSDVQAQPDEIISLVTQFAY